MPATLSRRCGAKSACLRNRRFHSGNSRISLIGKGVAVIFHFSQALTAECPNDDRRATQVILPSIETATTMLSLSGRGFFKNCAKAQRSARIFGEISGAFGRFSGFSQRS
jgi:hypothetical protein